MKDNFRNLPAAFCRCVFRCGKPYNPPVINSPNNYPVVEGVIKSGAHSTTTLLSRTVKFLDNVKVTIRRVNPYINYKKGAEYPAIPIVVVFSPGGRPIEYAAAAHKCVDCILKGTNIAPSFWK